MPKCAARKYAPAIKSLREKPRPITQVAKEFGLNSEVFRQYLKKHELSLFERHGMIRLKDGRKGKRSSYEKYQDAIRDYATSTDSIRVIADSHGIVYQTLIGFLLRLCPDERKSHQELVEKTKNKNQ